MLLYTVGNRMAKGALTGMTYFFLCVTFHGSAMTFDRGKRWFARSMVVSWYAFFLGHPLVLDRRLQNHSLGQLADH